MGGKFDMDGAPVLDYATPQFHPSRWRRLARLPLRLWRGLRSAGPWSIRPSWRSLLGAAATWIAFLWLRGTCVPWAEVARLDDRALQRDTFRLLPGGGSLVALSVDGAVEVIDLNGTRARRELKAPPGFGSFYRVWCSDDGRHALADNGAGIVKWDLATGQVVSRAPLLDHRSRPQQLSGAALSSAGDRFAVVDDRGAFQLWDVTTMAPNLLVRRDLLPDSRGASTLIEFSPDGRYAIVRFANVTLVIETSTGRKRGVAVDLDIVGFTPTRPESILVATSGAYAPPSIVDCRRIDDLSRPQKRILAPHWVDAACISPDGRRVALGGEGRITVWDTDTGEQLSEWPAPAWRHPSYVPRLFRARALCWVGNDRVASRDELPDELAIHRASDGRQVSRVPTRVRRSVRPPEVASWQDGTLFLVRGELTAWAPALSETPLGMLGRPAWWALFVASVGFAIALRRDNGRRARGWRPPYLRFVEVFLCVCGAFCVASLLAWLAMGGWISFALRASRGDHVGYWAGLAAMVCAIGSARGGSGWAFLMRMTIAVAAGLAIWAAVTAPAPPTYFYFLDLKFPMRGAVRSALWAVAAGACVSILLALRNERGEI